MARDITYSAMVFLEHLDIWIVRQTFFAYRREIGRLPAGSIQILLDLGRHVEDYRSMA